MVISNVSSKPFVCNPNKLCNQASCCRNPAVMPALSVVDYFRLGIATERTAADVWREDGGLSVSDDPRILPDQFIIQLGIEHNPCPFVLDDNSCSVYENRPIACAEYPFSLIGSGDVDSPEYAEFDCLRGGEFTRQQKVFYRELHAIMPHLERQDDMYFWDGLPRVVTMPPIDSFEKYMELCWSSIDSDEIHPKQKEHLSKNLTTIGMLISQSYHVDAARLFVSVFYYIKFHSLIARTLEEIESRFFDYYRELISVCDQLYSS